MTSLQKKIIEVLLDGGSVAVYHTGKLRLRDKNNVPIASFYRRTYRQIKQYLVYKKGLYTISRKAVREEHGGTWIKKFYKEHLKKSSNEKEQ